MGWIAWFTRKANKIPDKEFAPSTLGHRRLLEYLRDARLKLPFVQVLTARPSKSTCRASAPLVEIQPEVKVKSREKERERRRKRGKTRGGLSPRKPGRETSSRNWSEKLAPSFIVQKAFYTFDKTWRSMGNTELCGVCSPDSFYTSFCIQKVSGDLHYLLAKRLVNTF